MDPEVKEYLVGIVRLLWVIIALIAFLGFILIKRG